MSIAKITSKGQVTIPKSVRDRFNLRPGDEIEFVEEDAALRVVKHVSDSPFESWVGFLAHLAGRSSDELVEEMRGAVPPDDGSTPPPAQ
jgi:AbrB family looped-hinge helix DNA binding protein